MDFTHPLTYYFLLMIFYTMKINCHFKYLYLKMNKKYTGIFSAMKELSILQAGKAFMLIPISDKVTSIRLYYLILLFNIFCYISIIAIFISSAILAKSN